MPIVSKHSNHTPPPKQLFLKRTLHQERHLMENVDVPIVTISATFQNIFPESHHKRQEIVYSRAHYSQALACLIAAARINKSAWLIDPSNYVSDQNWPKVVLVEKIAEILARTQALKTLKSLLDKKAGGKLPITTAIENPLKYATARTKLPILSVHYATGNILAAAGKKILQIVTDPFVRPSYLTHAHKPHTFFAVFDTATKKDFLAKAEQAPNFNQKTLKNLKKRIFVTGPPVDPRITDPGKKKSPRNLGVRPLRLAITTGGVGTNKKEIEKMLEALSPRLKGLQSPLQLILYAGTHPDFIRMYQNYAKKLAVPIGRQEDKNAKLRIIYASNLLEANELLIKYVFPWADAIATKPSGDMAYDVIASGSALLLLSPIGKWEEHIRNIFITKNCAVNIDVQNFASQLTRLQQPRNTAPSKLQNLISKSLSIEKLYLSGAKTIVKTLLHKLDFSPHP